MCLKYDPKFLHRVTLCLFFFIPDLGFGRSKVWGTPARSRQDCWREQGSESGLWCHGRDAGRRHGQPWYPVLGEEEGTSDWPLNFLKMPWRFVKKTFLLHFRVKWMTLLKTLSFLNRHCDQIFLKQQNNQVIYI